MNGIAPAWLSLGAATGFGVAFLIIYRAYLRARREVARLREMLDDIDWQ